MSGDSRELLDTLYEVSRRTEGSRLHEAVENEILRKSAAWNAAECCRRRRQYHWDLDRRFEILRHELGTGRNYQEIAAESWPWNAEKGFTVLWEDMFKSWKYSKGHWRVVATKHEAIGVAMEKSAGGIWYATIVAMN